MLKESYTVTCTPAKSAPLDRVAVRVLGAPRGPLNWTVAGMDEGRFLVRRAAASATDESWEVTSARGAKVSVCATVTSSAMPPR